MKQKSIEELKRHNDEARRWDSGEETWMAHAASMHVPLNGTFELTPRCNLSCKMCYVRLSKKQEKQFGEELDADQWIQLGRQAAEAGTLYLLLTGGEPLLHPEFEKIYTEFSQMGFIITIYTNATLIDERIQALFEKYPPWDVGVTLYGASRETYEAVCGSADAYDRTIEGLERLKTVKTNLEIRTTYIKDNVEDMEAIYRIAEKYTLNYKINQEVFQAFPGVDSEVEACRLTPVEALDFLGRYIRFFAEENKGREEDAFYDSGKKDSGFDVEPANLSCLAAKCIYSISWNGRMTACNTFTVPYTEPLKVGFLKAWEELPELIRQLEKPKECEECQLDADGACANCPAFVYAETKRFDLVPDYICAYAKERRRRNEASQRKGVDKV